MSAKKVKEKKGLNKYPRTLLEQFYRTMLTIRSFEKKVEESSWPARYRVSFIFTSARRPSQQG
ncbi:MAG: hypothetical protein WCX92_06950 [Thermovirgaceae bacterium]